MLFRSSDLSLSEKGKPVYADKLKSDPDEQTVVGMIRGLREKGAGPGEIARRLNTAHVPCRGSVWHAKSVSRILERSA